MSLLVALPILNKTGKFKGDVEISYPTMEGRGAKTCTVNWLVAEGIKEDFGAM